ncbi:MAG TPA: SDR family NAD(P)-dependent oxidoreductase [Anaerolineae bacterium]|nr:SDR family NAD(P)-dependent oxidoreductase [Anaerolineae bacterium]
MQRILIAGASSGIAQAIARRFVAAAAQPGDLRFLLAGRDEARLTAVADDLRVRGAGEARTFVIDFADLGRQQALLDEARAQLGTVDLILVAWGSLPDQAAVERDPDLAARSWQENATATVAFLGHAATLLEAQRSGRLAVITSVAGDRGRRANYHYGAAKAAVIATLQGLRARLYPLGISVTDLRPGPVDTPMTASLKKGPLVCSAERSGRLSHAAIVRGRDIAYIPGYWRLIMTLVKLLPEGIFKRLNLAA